MVSGSQAWTVTNLVLGSMFLGGKCGTATYGHLGELNNSTGLSLLLFPSRTFADPNVHFRDPLDHLSQIYYHRRLVLDWFRRLYVIALRAAAWTYFRSMVMYSHGAVFKQILRNSRQILA